MDLGSKIKQLRILRQLTQEELADRCELTKGYISQLENGLTSPSISTLVDVLQALGTNLKEFFSDDDDEKVVFRDHDYIEKVTEENTINWLVPNAQANEMEPIMVDINPNSETEKDFPHEGEEFGFVIKGSITLVIGNNNYIVNEGETFYFTPNKPHYLKNNLNTVSKVIWVSSPPNF